MKQLVYVYISEISDDPGIPLPSYINEEKMTNRNVLAEKRSAYSLLYKAVKEVFGIDMDISKLTKTENGKPQYPGIYFSLSHTKELCAVAVSNESVGIDIEREISVEREARIRKKILHKNESPDTDITELWTKKEAVFKLKGDKSFVGSEIDTTAYHIFTDKIGADGSYIVTVAAEKDFEAKIKIL